MSDYQDSDQCTIDRFEKIYFSTIDQLIAFVKKNSPGNEMVDDIVQECFIVLWNKLSSLNDDERVINLLRTIAKRLMIDAHRKRAETLFVPIFFMRNRK